MSSFMYGGYGGILSPENDQYDEVWGKSHTAVNDHLLMKQIVLSLPAFTWQLVSADHAMARIGHTCHLVGNRQMLSIGGVDASQSDVWSVPDYRNNQGLGTFDLTNLEWTSSYNASEAPYERAPMLQAYYDSK